MYETYNRIWEGFLIQINKEQIWISISKNYEIVKDSLKNASDLHENEFRSARDRVINAGVHINSLFLTGWVALLSVGKLQYECAAVLYTLLTIGFSLHILVFALILISQWKTMRLNFNSQNRISEVQKVLRESTVSKREHLLSFDESEGFPFLQQKLNELDLPFKKSAEDYAIGYKKENDSAWAIGSWAMVVFFGSMIFSLIAFVVLLKPS